MRASTLRDIAFSALAVSALVAPPRVELRAPEPVVFRVEWPALELRGNVTASVAPLPAWPPLPPISIDTPTITPTVTVTAPTVRVTVEPTP